MGSNGGATFGQEEGTDEEYVSPAIEHARKRREQTLGEKTVSGRFIGDPDVGPGKKVSLNLITRGALSTHEFDDSKSAVFIGTDPEEADIVLSDPTLSKKQLAVMRVGNDYILADCGVKDMTSFNGIPCRQAVCGIGGMCVVNINEQTIIFDAARRKAARNAVGIRFGLGVDEPLKSAGKCQITLTIAHQGYRMGIDPLVVGSCAACNLCLSDTRLRPFHAMFHWTPEGFAVTRLSRDTVKVNSVDIDKSRLLSLTDRVQIGGANFTLNVNGNPAEEAAAMFADHDWSHQDFRFSPLPESISPAFDLSGDCGSIFVGRSEEADITLDDSGVSRDHLQLIPSGKTVMVLDNYSANGTYVNGEQVNKARIRPGDCVEIGRSIFCLHYH